MIRQIWNDVLEDVETRKLHTHKYYVEEHEVVRHVMTEKEG